MRVEQQSNLLEALQQNSGTDTKGKVFSKEKALVKYTENKETTTVSMKDSTYLNPAKEEKKTAVEEMEESTQMDARDRKNQMAVLSHTTSEEDYAKMQEEGFSLDSTTANTIVTVTDKIKMQLAKAGKDISCFGDDLTLEQLAEMTGSTAVAVQLEHMLKEADLPADEENMEYAMEAVVQASALGELSEGAVRYLLDNELEPTIENIYKAEFSGSSVVTGNAAMEELPADLEKQIEKVITDAGLPVSEDTLEEGKWLLANELPVTKENLRYLEQLQSLELPLAAEQLINSIVEAISEGKTPQDALLVAGFSLHDQAKQAMEVVEQATEEDLAYVITHDMELTVDNLAIAAANRGNVSEEQSRLQKEVQQGETQVYSEKGLQLLTARRQLEEVRLAMSAEANYRLIKSGISIDTEPLVKLVDELKNAENEYYANLLQAQGADATEENVTVFAETTEKLEAMKSVPAYVLGIPEADTDTIEGVYEAGTALKAAMEKASESYETLMTAPRADMGDSMQKAFRNVEAILTDLGMEESRENQRAVRILAYNELEITEESVLKMKAADENVQRVFKNLSPAVVTEMIKKGINPLEMDFATLNQMAEEIGAEVGKSDQERFSEYLWKLEKNHEITQEERDTYIGIYRLIHQVEQTDGAAIGALVNQGVDLTLKNLLMAVRTEKKENKMDITVDESFGERENDTTLQNSITDQIMAAYQTNCMKDAGDLLTPGRLQAVMAEHSDWENMTPEQFATALEQADESAENTEIEQQYIKEQLSMMRQCANSSEEIYQILQQYDIPNTMMNIMAVESMMKNRNQLFKQLFEEQGKDDNEITPEDIQKIKEELIEEFGEAVSTPEDMAKAQQTLAEVAENVMKTMIESTEVTSLDVREARLMQAKIAIGNHCAKKEKYDIPVLVGDEVTNVSLKIIRGVDTKGIVDIMLESQMKGKIAATFQAKEEGMSGLIATDDAETRELLADNIGMFASALQEDMEKAVDFRVVYIGNLDLNHFSGTTLHASQNAYKPETGVVLDSAEGNEQAGETYKVQTARLYRIAESFIRTVKELS